MALTFDKPHLSGPTIGWNGRKSVGIAVNGTKQPNPDQADRVAGLVRDSLSENTRKAYASDLARFEDWGGSIPAKADKIAAYLSEHAETHAPTTIARWLASLSKAHRAIRAEDPTKDELVRSILRGIRRRYGRPYAQATPLTKELLFEALEALPEGLRGARDRALLLIGFAGGFRRAELIDLEIGDVTDEDEGLVLTIRRSKTDQFGRGRAVGIPYARGRHCAVNALRSWIERASITDGPIFRGVDRHGRVSPIRLTGQAVSLVVKERVSAAGLNTEGFSGHSLRSGFVTSAAKEGVSSWKIREQTGHASDAMLARYIRDIDIFTDNAAGALL